MKTNKLLIILLTSAAVGLAGCVSNPKKATTVAQPKTPATKTITSFSSALRCMDNLYASYGVNDVIITSAGLPDATGQVQTGTKEMMISAISKMSIKSNAFRFVDYDPTQIGVQDLHNLIGIRTDLGFDIPRYYIRGAITQVDSGVTSDSVGGGISLPAVSIGISKDQTVSVLAMDMNMGDMITRQILPGIQANNSIAIVRSGTGGDMDGKIGKAGLFFQMSMDRSEGTHQSVRTLIELSLIELMGKLTKVPYWRCLDIPQTNPTMMTQAQEWFDVMDAKERVTLVQRALSGAGYMSSKVSGVMDSETREAIGRYQSENGLIADGRINFDLYYSFLSNDLVLAKAPETVEGGDAVKDADTKKAVEVARTQLSRLGTPVNLSLVSDQGANPTLRVGQPLNVRVGVNEGAYVYCYYQDAGGNVARIFPNRFQPNAYLRGGQTISVPENSSQFSLVMEQPGATETVMCAASRREVGLGMSARLKKEDLTPLGVGSVDDIISELRGIDRSGLTSKKLQAQVVN